ncbi:ferritin-like domain-containing protein [Psychroserpens sp. NJDZ02]|uniref:ferritin-like domain-containing protein n=1 Tax=Psychroserpens sp. NJDZ02 TaxID=2570561 RepID=UPI0010A79E4E|nr:PA2169 family four-helix-bundle protein [Psychroserpens sp. NJDZ02]QCE41018.1 PA2169 family four-helix-bundle protein [Psychroserpens sp. NJDZ02]
MKTTKDNNALVNTLQDLLQKNYDAEAGYKQVMQKTENAPLKNWMQQKALQRNTFATELDFQIRKHNAEPKTSGTIAADLHRGWINVKSTLSSETDEALLEECIRGEKASLSEYEEKLEQFNEDSEIKTIIESQLTTVRSALNTVKRLEDIIG